ncbi:uncharacterized protein LOC121372619 [Gigantopelta aegis]|uniref:uncharacterized protein LOC121372619 n=1 Tax=Gigantopelta aegis TaxID=1735272 RepID=UPI001B88851A|nr:uncharacterized protein LOC121372619 [Gigantopelta aegis]XP_041354989.1 uncharacterized protein LOC121372619 [Gigantopelta aegis]XP_041354998.1 uncharacterized protein LOC121372619 [Gigantopelta aegis]XP_041355007.1 uncharacterized protein LOC121372619 [Gigantopelta aegis]
MALRFEASVTLLLILGLTSSEAFNCKWSNEGCTSYSECCSKRCEQRHPGTNPRCTKSMLNQFCLNTYQCEDRLLCGKKNRCCAKYWGACRRKWDCCEPDQFCLEVDGFYYRRCLYGKVVYKSRGAQEVVMSTFLHFVYPILTFNIVYTYS